MTKIEPKAALASLLLMAPFLTPAPGGLRAQETVTVPLEVVDGRLVIQATTDAGTPLRMLVTTGSAVTVLTESGARKIGSSGVNVGGIAVNMEGHQTVPDTDLRVGGAVLDGLVSNNTLNPFNVLFDAPNGRLLLKPAGQAVAWPGVALSEPVRIRVYHGVVLGVDVEIDGKPYLGMLELGAASLLVNQAVLAGTGITDGTADLTLGRRVYKGLPIRLSDHPVIERFSPNGDGFVLVGAPPAAACAIAVSWIHREIRTCLP